MNTSPHNTSLNIVTLASSLTDIGKDVTGALMAQANAVQYYQLLALAQKGQPAR